MSASDVTAFAADGAHYGLFGPGLRRPTHLICAQTQVPARYDEYSFRHDSHCDMVLRPRLAQSLAVNNLNPLKAFDGLGRGEAGGHLG
jgi:hypothetical protein